MSYRHASKRHRPIEAALEQLCAEHAATWGARRNRLPPRPAVGVGAASVIALVAIATRRHWRFSKPPVATARRRLRLTVTTVRALQRLSKPWVVAEQAIIGVEHATALVGGPPGLVVVFVAESDDVLPRVLDIALSAAKELIDLGLTTFITPLAAVARHMEEGVVEHDGMGVDVVRACHLGEHLALMPVH